MYEWKTRIRYSELEANGRLSLSSLVDLFQDCANFDSEDKGVGLHYLTEKGICWVLLTWQIDVKRFPRMGEEVVVYTSPYHFKASFGHRNFMMKTAEGEMLAVADSMWLMVDYNSHKPLRIPEDIYGRYTLEEAYFKETSKSKILLEDGVKKLEESFVVGRQHLDTNNHVNNARYVSFAREYLPKSAEVKSVRIQYRKQARLGDSIYAYTGTDAEGYKVLLCNEAEEIYAALVFTLAE